MTIPAGRNLLYLARGPAFHHAQRRIGEDGRAVLLDDAVAGADEAAAGAAFRQPRLDDLAFAMDRVAGNDRGVDVEFHVQEGEAGVLHRRLRQEPLGKAVDKRARRRTALNVALVGEEFDIREENLDHAGAVDEVGDVGLGDGAADRLEAAADRQVLEIEAEPDNLHVLLLPSRRGAAYRRRRTA